MPHRDGATQRRARLARAVWSVMSERGLSAVSMRSVAAAAGVSVGSLQHTFPTREDLLVYSADLMVQRVQTRIADESVDGEPVEVALRLLAHLLPLTPDSRVEMDVNVALVAESRALPRLAVIRDEAHRSIAQGCRRIVALLAPELGEEEAGRRAARLHALVDGIALHLLHAPPESDHAWALEMLGQELAALASSPAGGVSGGRRAAVEAPASEDASGRSM
ncbi:MAG: TetR/AcrR family transcriptional regulator [Actinomyces sp.]|nr:TetR/AcrR family transcriptional regulator [Actinomyces sp.]MCI1662322.1 TetR/AcrR family transcriptional regulator [Actinomyces sp.]